MDFADSYLDEVVQIAQQIDRESIESAIGLLVKTRNNGGRLFILGVGGSAANASHAVNDFRKICGFNAYSPCDNVAELTTRINDEGWSESFKSWLYGSNLSPNDLVMVLSVGGGSEDPPVSVNIVEALKWAVGTGSAILAIVGRDGGYAGKIADVCIQVPTVNPDHTTPHSEAFQGVIWHLLVSHPDLKISQTRWESL